MTLVSAQDISHCQIEVEAQEDWYFVTAIRDGKPLATHGADHLKKALKGVVEKVYAINREAAFEKAGYRCVRCGKIVPLQAHHVIHRARGQRDDSVENLDPLCAEHHEQEHGAKR